MNLVFLGIYCIGILIFTLLSPFIIRWLKPEEDYDAWTLVVLITLFWPVVLAILLVWSPAFVYVFLLKIYKIFGWIK